MACLDFWILPVSVLAERDFMIHAPTEFHVPSMGFQDLLVIRQAVVEHPPHIVQPDEARHLRGEQVLHVRAIVLRRDLLDLLHCNGNRSRRIGRDNFNAFQANFSALN